MIYRTICEESLPEAIESALIDLSWYGEEGVRENQNQKERCKEIRLVINVIRPQEEPKYSKAIPCGKADLKNYIDEFINGTADNKGWHYTYHQLYEPFYGKVIAEFKRCKHTRRACISLGQGDINFTEYPPCLQLLMFDIVDDCLEITAVFRSNDAVKAFGMNIQAIAELQKKVAEELGFWAGELHYIVNSFHAYERDWRTLKNYVKMFSQKPYKKRIWRSE